MARKVITVLTDDLDGGKADRTVEFSLDGVAYTIDVSDENAGVLRKALDPYINAGRRIGRGPVESTRSVRRPGRPAGAGMDREQNRAIREWAVKNGYKISERGRIPVEVVEAYKSR
ncbi:histone-like nucleoid-structuring protein Lsr2 [Micromonospora arida]|uniref:Nucleoid-associated protein Lsr2 n=4 Tax=Micromonospora TaxID=1873 RepID=A0A328N2N7_9ACTN|nr:MULTISPECIES: Lsr2 family protein [Micromonospora]KAB1921868.1 Lsr2 family protein [Micromonospora noduli]MBQ1019962.1 Lsr2 family protein [Micromonospora sp. D93]MCG5439118.1 Lsr2 family protein [Micromonospora foliorum]RAN95580.1 Nucleoid-associated protein Lsr2 [Micromonospora saelicesensis]RAN96257.1 Nucleoid-associated protein Lsr2 [Micromonospora noduli]